MVIAGVHGNTGSTGPRGNTGPVDSYVRTFNGLTGNLQGVSGIQGGTGISVNGTTGNVTVSNIGVLSLTGSTGILLNGTTGNISIQNIGVLSINGVTGILEGVSSLTAAVTNPGLTLTGSTGAIVIRNTGVLGVSAGSGIQILTSGSGTKTFNNMGVLSVNAITNNVGITAGTNIDISSSGNTLTISAPNQFTLNGLTGSVTLSAGSNMGVTVSGNNILLSSSGSGGSSGPIILDDNVYIRGVCGPVGSPKAIIAIDPTISDILISSENGAIALNDFSPNINGAGIALNLSTKSITLGAQNISIIGNVNTITGNIVNRFNGATGNIQGVNSLQATNGIFVSGSTGNIQISNSGVRQIIGTSQQIDVSPSGGTGNVILSLPGVIANINQITGETETPFVLTSSYPAPSISGAITLAENSVTINPALTVSGEMSVVGNLTVTGTYGGNVVRSFNGKTGALQGVSGISAGTGITISPSGGTGTVTVTNNGVLSFNGSRGAIEGVTRVNGATGAITVTGGTNITVTTSGTQVTVGLTSLTAGPTGGTGATGPYGFNSGIISQYKENSLNCFGAAGFTAGVFYFVLCNTVGGPGCTCVNSSNNNAAGFIISGIEYFGADISAYFENLISVFATTGYLFIRYYNSDPSRANYMKPIEVTGIQIITSGSNKNICFSIEQIGSIALPTNNDVYAITYQPVFFV
jgi:hypothetical protein